MLLLFWTSITCRYIQGLSLFLSFLSNRAMHRMIKKPLRLSFGCEPLLFTLWFLSLFEIIIWLRELLFILSILDSLFNPDTLCYAITLILLLGEIMSCKFI